MEISFTQNKLGAVPVRYAQCRPPRMSTRTGPSSCAIRVVKQLGTIQRYLAFILFCSRRVKEMEAYLRLRGFGNSRRRPSKLAHDSSPYMQLSGIATKCFEDSHALLEINFKHPDFISGLGPTYVCGERTPFDPSKICSISQLVSYLGSGAQRLRVPRYGERDVL